MRRSTGGAGVCTRTDRHAGRPASGLPQVTVPPILRLTMEASVVLPQVLQLFRDSKRKSLSAAASIRQQLIEAKSGGLGIVPWGAQPVRYSGEP